MKPQKQKFHHDPANGSYGDCVRTVFACLLNLDRDTVPHFGDADPPHHVRANAEREWLMGRGLVEVTIPYVADTLDEILYTFGSINPGVYYLLTGQSRTGCDHVVICRSHRIVWDTSLTDAGIVGPSSTGHYFVSVLARANS